MSYTKTDDLFLEKVNEETYNNLEETKLNVEKFAGLVNRSKPTLYCKIKSTFDLTPNELINITRLKKPLLYW